MSGFTAKLSVRSALAAAALAMTVAASAAQELKELNFGIISTEASRQSQERVGNRSCGRWRKAQG